MPILPTTRAHRARPQRTGIHARGCVWAQVNPNTVNITALYLTYIYIYLYISCTRRVNRIIADSTRNQRLSFRGIFQPTTG